MAYQMVNNTGKFEKPDVTSQFLGILMRDEFVAYTGMKSNDGWVKVQAPGDATAVWIRLEDCREVPDDQVPILRVDHQAFVTTCLIAERILNSLPETPPHYINADFLIARALIEAGLTHTLAVVSRSDGVGPLRVTSQEWSRFLADAGEFKTGYQPADRFHPTLQVRGAAWTMHVDVKEISRLRNEKDVADLKRTADDVKKDPFVPSYLDVFLSYLAGTNPLTGNPEAAVDLRAALEADPNTTVVSALNGVLTADQVNAMFANRKGFEDTPQPAKVGEFVDVARTVLNTALKKAFELIKGHSPEDLPTVTNGGAPWLDIADDARTRGVSETSHNAEIVAYFDATDFGPRPASSVDTPWCGAFAAFCMKESKSPTVAASIPKGAAASSSWANWGAPIPMGAAVIPKGAVVVLSQSPETGTSGHVGFYVGPVVGGKKIELLGGNQSNKVSIAPFDIDRVAAIRWLDLPNAQATTAFKLPGDIPADRRPHADLIVRLFAEAGFGKFHQIAALANAIAESGLDPEAHAQGEDSVGLFQLRRIKGVGGNHSVEDLKKPDFNTQLIIAEAKKKSLFVNATTLRNAVFAFVLAVERPANGDVKASERLTLAESLLVPG